MTAYPERNEGLHVGVLQDFNVCVNGAQECERDDDEPLELVPFKLVHVRKAEGTCDGDNYGSASELAEQHESWRVDRVHSELVCDQHQGRASHVTDNSSEVAP